MALSADYKQEVRERSQGSCHDFGLNIWKNEITLTERMRI